MPRSSDRTGRGEFDAIKLRIILRSFQPIVRIIALSLALGAASCDRSPPETQKEKAKASSEKQPALAKERVKQRKLYLREGNAVWYVVPDGSLAKRRAGRDEFTAAHNHLPLGTMVRVTHLANGKSVIVRITDRGITKRDAIIDLCKEAAEQLGMVREGMAHVRMEELAADDEANTASGSDKPAAPL
jgi:rare lipoprotein A